MKNVYVILEKYKIYMDINFEYYKIYYYVAKYENITRAATALGSNQPNVTRVMKLLESQLGCRLFIREARGIRLTEEGERLYSHVEVAYRHLMNAQEENWGTGNFRWRFGGDRDDGDGASPLFTGRPA